MPQMGNPMGDIEGDTGKRKETSSRFWREIGSGVP